MVENKQQYYHRMKAKKMASKILKYTTNSLVSVHAYSTIPY